MLLLRKLAVPLVISESLPYLEAIRQIKSDVGRDNCMYIHVTLVPYLSSAGEAKTSQPSIVLKNSGALVSNPMP